MARAPPTSSEYMRKLGCTKSDSSSWRSRRRDVGEQRGPVCVGADVEVCVKDRELVDANGRPIVLAGKVIAENADGTLAILKGGNDVPVREEGSGGACESGVGR